MTSLSQPSAVAVKEKATENQPIICYVFLLLFLMYNELSKINTKIDNTKQISTNNITKLAEQKTDFQFSRKIKQRLFFHFWLALNWKFKGKLHNKQIAIKVEEIREMMIGSLRKKKTLVNQNWYGGMNFIFLMNTANDNESRNKIK